MKTDREWSDAAAIQGTLESPETRRGKEQLFSRDSGERSALLTS